MFRRPDVSVSDDHAIWYGPGGPAGEHATEVAANGLGYHVREHTDVRGLIDQPPQRFLVTATYVTDTEASGPREAATIGTARIARWGGDESWTDTLPR